MILQFPLRERRRAGKQERPALERHNLRSAPAHDALAACRAELRAIARSATVLATGLAENQGSALMRRLVHPLRLAPRHRAGPGLHGEGKVRSKAKLAL